MVTKYDRQQIAEGERAKRQKNMQDLEQQMAEARELLQVIRPSDWEKIKERRVVSERLKELQEYYDGEREAYNATFQDEETAQQIADTLTQ